MTLEAATIPITVGRGATYIQALRAVDDDGLPHAFDDDTAELYAFAADDPDGDTALVTLTTDNGGVTLGLDGVTAAETTLASGASADAATVDVTSTTGIAAGQVVTVALDAGGRHVARATGVSGTTVTLSHALPSAAAAGNAVVAYSTAGFGPYNILLYINETSTAGMAPFTGWYHLDRIDSYGRHQRIGRGPFCVEGGK